MYRPKDRRFAMTVLSWLLVAVGFTGAMTLRYLARKVLHAWMTPPSVAVNFSPKGGCTEAVVGELKHARHHIQVLAYSFSSKPIAQALIDAKLRGVQVEIVLDHSNEKEGYSDLKFFLDQGLVPVIDPQHAIAHNKVMIIDGKTLITGSFNFTHQAENENAENLLVIKGHPEIVTAYRQNFTTHRSHCRAVNGAAQPKPDHRAQHAAPHAAPQPTQKAA
jgi:phosphatidylserine/phosphatidylglycerophosphate/cardiolipin synthase-like enzyme